MIDERINSLKEIKALFNEMVKQHSQTTASPLKESKLKTGLMLLYFWAMAHDAEEVKKKLFEEAGELFESVGNFFVQVEIDYDNLMIERPDIIGYLKTMGEEEYNQLIRFVQNEFKAKV